ncbi:hypothetical protein [Columbia Basin potato purple top phytoplasma]|uniref:Uncharacterized protein n=1 Tax=Columbia Basin potato purple top phytoplasma TaxID=307134 RepID=A0ABT5LB25_9MOLU|nr:hypothetical protein [Columbia Basin potato purple top phytoplasma]MDC9031908.1 hypothetical protein [Columbia Basin potato purple top phytoplasma]
MNFFIENNKSVETMKAIKEPVEKIKYVNRPIEVIKYVLIDQLRK